MFFASGTFLYYFLPVFLALYFMSPRRARTLVIAVASYFFYGWWRPDFVILMWISTAVDFACGRKIEAARAENPTLERAGKSWLLLSLAVNLGLLAYFKYANFGIETLNSLLLHAGIEPVRWVKVILPVGISFYTFQTLSYTIDVYRGVAKPVRSLADFACYVSMFPQLLAGPIVRYNTIADQLHSRTHTFTKFSTGVLAFQAGLAKKVLLADVLSGVADAVYDPEGGAFDALDAWLGTLAYALQVYFDFSGYSDMAIGLGLMLGFRLPINFNSPYRAVDFTDYWRRWHLSLTAFLRDYLYIPLGGNRRGSLRTYVNITITFLLGGLWHGANWTFVAWGAYQGFWLIAERIAGQRFSENGGLWGSLSKPARVLVTFVVIMIGLVFFRSETMSDAWQILGTMFGSEAAVHPALEGSRRLFLVRPIHWLAGGIGLAICWFTPTTQSLLKRTPLWWILALQVLFLWSLVHLHYEDHVPFLYFQF